MARITVRVPVRSTWSITDRLRLYLGTENAASLAASTPAGGTLAAEVPARGDGAAVYGWGEGEWGEGGWGGSAFPRAVLVADYLSTDKCAQLPLGVRVIDAAGNESDVYEGAAQLADPPIGARDLTVEPTDDPLEALLSWTASPDV